MNNLKELLQDADPLRREAAPSASECDSSRRAVLAADPTPCVPAGARPRLRVAAAGTLMVAAAALAGVLMWSLFSSSLQAAIRFQVKLAETSPAPGLQKAKVSGSDRFVYLHPQDVVTNSDIEGVQVVRGSGPSEYAVSVRLNKAGARKMSAATRDHLGKPIAILLDGRVIMVPVVRAVVGASAMITGNFTREQAEKIAKGIEVQ